MTTTNAQSPYSPPLSLAGPQPIATLASTRQGPVREMTEMLSRRYGPGLQIKQQQGRTTWLLPAPRKQATR